MSIRSTIVNMEPARKRRAPPIAKARKMLKQGAKARKAKAKVAKAKAKAAKAKAKAKI